MNYCGKSTWCERPLCQGRILQSHYFKDATSSNPAEGLFQCPGSLEFYRGLRVFLNVEDASLVGHVFRFRSFRSEARILPSLGVSSFAASSFDRWIYVIGGGPNGKLATDKVQCWEPGTESWELRAPIPIETKCTNAVTFKKCIYIVGGAMQAMYCYSPLSDSWSLVTRLGERASCAIAACNNKLFITGGRDNKNQVISTVMCWDVGRGVLTEECVLPMGVSHHGSVTLMKSYTHIHRITPA